MPADPLQAVAHAALAAFGAAEGYAADGGEAVGEEGEIAQVGRAEAGALGGEGAIDEDQANGDTRAVDRE
ncbi:MAG: hypothetical protein CL908_23485, partial [Deltaproteobacteria bacterium]|nr:hypothetical protein [Deltaproteobacteria bacterium]